MADIQNGTVTITGLSEFEEKLKKLKTDNPDFEKRLRGAIREILKEARNELSGDAQTGLQMQSDLRKAYKAVRYAVYKRILGGQVNILAKRKAGTPTNYRKPLKGLPKRGGNRWGRSQRTKDIEGYEGTDRGFILRFINAGTADRMITSYTDREGQRHTLRSGSTSNIKTRATGGNRGSIAARNWFGSASHKELENASAQMQELIDKIIAQEFV